ncbi:MAG: hypothetical protein P9M14_13550 [Candidatus Alcyoniella australis]|nr:hypothetical protein [Candidatus Alcyoniella australis]
MTERHDSENHEYTEISTLTTGNPTKASEGNALRTNVEYALDASVQGLSPDASYNSSQADAAKSGFAIIDVYAVCQEGNGAQILDPDNLPFDLDDSDQMSLYDRFITIEVMWVCNNAADKTAMCKFLPGGEYDDAFSTGSTQSHGTIEHGTNVVRLWTGPGQLDVTTGKYAGTANYTLEDVYTTTGTWTAWVDTDDDNLYLRADDTSTYSYWFACAIRITVGPRTTHYSA